MCLAMCSPAGSIIPKDNLERAFQSNPDGAGFAYAKDGELNIVKGLMTFEELWSEYKNYQELDTIVHVRIQTHGDTDQDNTHPFQVGNRLAFIHNGVISRVDRTEDTTKSDTFWFNQKLLVPIYKRDSRFIFKDHFKELIKEYIGGSKLVFLNNKGHYAIVNEKAGHWHEGVWYSNHSYEERKIIAPFHSKKEKQSSEVFSIDSRVKVEYEHSKQLNGEGTVSYFTGGQMLGVQMDGMEHPRLVHMSYVTPIVHETKFKIDDWVVRKDKPDNVGEVQGLVGNSVVVRWLGANGTFEKPDYVMSPDKLDFWWSDSLEGLQ